MDIKPHSWLFSSSMLNLSCSVTRTGNIPKHWCCQEWDGFCTASKRCKEQNNLGWNQRRAEFVIATRQHHASHPESSFYPLIQCCIVQGWDHAAASITRNRVKGRMVIAGLDFIYLFAITVQGNCTISLEVPLIQGGSTALRAVAAGQ